MPVYQYSAVNGTGENIQGRFEASNNKEIVQMIREKGYFPLAVKEVVKGKDIGSLGFLNKVRTRDIAVFCRQFQAMLSAGVTIIQCLDILRQQTENKKFREVIGELYEEVQKGSTFSEALKNHQNIFPEILISMAEAGEVSGQLDIIMERMAVHFEKENRLQSKVKGAMVYPVILSIVCVAVVILLLTAVMPTFIGMFTSSGVELPAPTRALLAISSFLRRFWYILVAVIGGAVYLFRRFIKTETGRYKFDRFKLNIPVVKGTLKKMATSRFTRTLSTLMVSGIPLMQAMEIVARVVGNRVVARGILNAREELRRGINLSEPIKKMRVFPPMVESMVMIGEESGTLDSMLEKTANFYDEEVEVALQKMVTMIEPALIIFMGGVVGFIVISIALPMFDMANTVK